MPLGKAQTTYGSFRNTLTAVARSANNTPRTNFNLSAFSKAWKDIYSETQYDNFLRSRFNGSPTHFCPGTKVKIKVLSLILKRLSARSRLRESEGNGTPQDGFSLRFLPLKSGGGVAGWRSTLLINLKAQLLQKLPSGAAAIRRIEFLKVIPLNKNPPQIKQTAVSSGLCFVIIKMISSFIRTRHSASPSVPELPRFCFRLRTLPPIGIFTLP